MSRYKAYPAYRDSETKWLGAIPNHWTLFDGKRLFSNRRESAHEGDEQLAASQKYGVVPQSLMMEMNDAKVMLALKGTSSFRHVGKNDFVISLRSFEGGIEHSSYVGCVSPAYTVLQAEKEVVPAYFKYLLKSGPYIAALQASTDSLRDGKSISYEQFGAIALPYPIADEQAAIAAFLDHETAKIDTLIEKQQRLIELLKEKRQAVISHAVTKGLNPNAPMKDSGVEWLGEVPAHWTVNYLKHISSIRYGIGEPPSYQEEGVPLIRATNIRSGRVAEENLVFVNPRDIPTNRIVWLKEGDIIVVRSGAGTGDSSLIPANYDSCIAGFDMVVRPVGCFQKFIGHALLSNYIRNNQIDLEKTRAAQPHLNAEELGGCFVLLPPISEQVEIANRLDVQLSKFDELIHKAEKTIGLLQERRTALISAAVTGKIDVRDWQAAA